VGQILIGGDDLHSVLFISKGGKPSRRLETPSKSQAEILRIFGYQVDDRGVLQNISR